MGLPRRAIGLEYLFVSNAIESERVYHLEAGRSLTISSFPFPLSLTENGNEVSSPDKSEMDR